MLPLTMKNFTFPEKGSTPMLALEYPENSGDTYAVEEIPSEKSVYKEEESLQIMKRDFDEKKKEADAALSELTSFTTPLRKALEDDDFDSMKGVIADMQILCRRKEEENFLRLITSIQDHPELAKSIYNEKEKQVSPFALLFYVIGALQSAINELSEIQLAQDCILRRQHNNIYTLESFLEDRNQRLMDAEQLVAVLNHGEKREDEIEEKGPIEGAESTHYASQFAPSLAVPLLSTPEALFNPLEKPWAQNESFNKNEGLWTENLKTSPHPTPSPQQSQGPTTRPAPGSTPPNPTSIATSLADSRVIFESSNGAFSSPIPSMNALVIPDYSHHFEPIPFSTGSAMDRKDSSPLPATTFEPTSLYMSSFAPTSAFLSSQALSSLPSSLLPSPSPLPQLPRREPIPPTFPHLSSPLPHLSSHLRTLTYQSIAGKGGPFPSSSPSRQSHLLRPTLDSLTTPKHDSPFLQARFDTGSNLRAQISILNQLDQSLSPIPKSSVHLRRRIRQLYDEYLSQSSSKSSHNSYSRVLRGALEKNTISTILSSELIPSLAVPPRNTSEILTNLLETYRPSHPWFKKAGEEMGENQKNSSFPTSTPQQSQELPTPLLRWVNTSSPPRTASIAPSILDAREPFEPLDAGSASLIPLPQELASHTTDHLITHSLHESPRVPELIPLPLLLPPSLSHNPSLPAAAIPNPYAIQYLPAAAMDGLEEGMSYYSHSSQGSRPSSITDHSSSSQY